MKFKLQIGYIVSLCFLWYRYVIQQIDISIDFIGAFRVQVYNTENKTQLHTCHVSRLGRPPLYKKIAIVLHTCMRLYD